MFGVPIPLSIIGKLKTGNSNRKGRRGSKGKTDRLGFFVFSVDNAELNFCASLWI